MKPIQILLLLLTLSSGLDCAVAQTWTQTGAPTNYWVAVASSADGSRLVAAAGGQFYNGPIYTSTNTGANWISNTAPVAHWNSVASSADGIKLAATIYGGGIYTSTNAGETWETNNVPNYNWQAIASSADGVKLSAVYFNNRIFSQPMAGSIGFPIRPLPRIWRGWPHLQTVAG